VLYIIYTYWPSSLFNSYLSGHRFLVNSNLPLISPEEKETWTIYIKAVASHLKFLEWSYYNVMKLKKATAVGSVGNKNDLAMHKLILTIRKRPTTWNIDMWFNTSTTIWDKVTPSSASNRTDARMKNKRRIGLSTWRKKKTGDGDRRTPGVEGRRRPASSRDGASQKPNTLPTPCRDARKRRLRILLSRHRWHVGDGMGKTAAAQHCCEEEMNLSRGTEDDVSPYIYTRVAAKESN
jgi:hypothetical protein